MEEKKPEEKKTKRQIAKEKAKDSTKKFQREFKKALNTAILAAFGFIIALSWRELIVKYVDEISTASPLKGELISALVITIISVTGIIISTGLLTEKPQTE